jgi:hypothetical protein
VVDIAKGIAASSSLPKTMRVIAELPIEVGIQNQAHGFCYELV